MRVASAWVLSVVAHLIAVGLPGVVAVSRLGALRARTPVATLAPSHDNVVPIDLPIVVGTALVSDTVPLVSGTAPIVLPDLPAPRGGGEAAPRLDTSARGRGGED